MDLVIRGGVLGTAPGAGPVDIGVDGGEIVQIGGPMAATDEIDARGRLVLPGGVDVHVHLTPTSAEAHGLTWADDFESGSLAALAGGITTVGNVSFPYGDEGLMATVDRDIRIGEARSACDFVIHPVLTRVDPATIGEIAALAEAGQPSIKLFLSFRRFDRQVSGYVEAMRQAGRHGLIVMAHCEDSSVIDCACSGLRAASRLDARFYPESRPVAAESIATARAIEYARAAGARLYVVHLAAADALAHCRAARAAGTDVFVETRPMYLHLTAERYGEPQGARFAGYPPLRSAADVDALWAGLRFGDIDVVATDHAPWALAAKLDPSLDATTLRPGVAELETSLPTLWSQGVRTGRIGIERFVEVTSSAPARLFGLYPRKGSVTVGADADLVVWDPGATWVVDASEMHTRADYSPYDGMEVTGSPELTISRGEVVAVNRRAQAEPGRGRALRSAR